MYKIKIDIDILSVFIVLHYLQARLFTFTDQLSKLFEQTNLQNWLKAQHGIFHTPFNNIIHNQGAQLKSNSRQHNHQATYLAVDNSGQHSNSRAALIIKITHNFILNMLHKFIFDCKFLLITLHLKLLQILKFFLLLVPSHLQI